MTVGELFDGGPRAGRRADRDRPPRLRLGADRPRRGRRRRSGRRSSGASGCSGRTGWPTLVLSNHDQPRQASRLRHGRPARDDVDAIAKAAAVLLARRCGGRRSCTTARRSGMVDVDDPAGRDRRPAGAHRRAGLPVVEPRPVPDADAVDRRAGRRLHDRPAVAPDRRRTRPAGTSPREAADPDSVLATYRRLLEVAPAPSLPCAAARTSRSTPATPTSSPGGGSAAGVAGRRRGQLRGVGLPDRGCRRGRGAGGSSPATAPRSAGSAMATASSTLRPTRGGSSSPTAVSAGRRIALLRYGRTPSPDRPEALVPLEFLKRKGSSDQPTRPPRSRRRRPARSRCPRRSSPRTTSSSCTTPARAARASGCGPARTRWPSCRRCSTASPRARSRSSSRCRSSSARRRRRSAGRPRRCSG